MKRLIYILLLLPMMLYAQQHTINGYVCDAQSGERLIGAAVFDTITQRGSVTNTAGFYTLTLPEGEHALQVCYVGYHPSKPQMITLTKDTFISVSVVSSTRLEEVTVIAHQSISGPQSAQMSAIEVPISQIKGIPAIGGEVDILKAIQLLPGVQSGSEGTTGIYVRGGGPDENLILLDGVPLYNVSHLMGFFSVFNADAVKNVTLYKGNFPARYGSRLSSVIDVRQNDGNATGYHGNLSVGLLSAKLNVEGPIYWNKSDWQHFAKGDTVRAKTTFNISARRTYFDLFTAPLIALVAKAAEGIDATGGYYFYDLNAKLSHTFSENDRLSASFYMGDDVMYLRYGFNETWSSELFKGNLNMRMGWGNLVAAANWEHRYNSRLFSNTQVAFTRYRYHLGESMHEDYTYWDEDNVKQTSVFDQSMGYDSNIHDVSANTHFELTPNSKHTLNFGAEFIYHQFQPSVTNFFIAELGDGMPPFKLDTTVLGGKLMRGYEATAYFEDSYTPWSWLKLNLGLRTSLYHTGGKTYPSIEPRVGARALITKDLAFKASYSYTSQYVHLLSNSSISLPTDLWVPVTAHIPPMHSMIAAAGLSYDILGQLEISVEGYYKRMKNLIEYKDGATFFGSSTGWEDKVVVGDGWSYGVEFLLQRKVGPVTGWIGYTWSRTMRQFNREGQEINFGKPFHAKYDREHDLSVTLQYAVSKKVDLGATFVYGTGQRATLGTQVYNDPTTDNSAVSLPTQNRVISERNNYVMPDYHRLDLGATFHIPHHKSGDPSLSKGGWLTNAEHQVYVGVYNVYCRMNPYMLYESNGKLYQISLFPLLPSISYNFKF